MEENMEQTEPPSYETPKYDGVSDVFQPVILLLSGCLVQSESAGLPVLYELDRDVNLMGQVTRKAVFSRHEPRPNNNTSYQRHIYDLECPHAITSTSRYTYLITSVSRKALGSVGLKKTSVPRPGFKVMRINRSDEDEELFEISKKDGRYEWWDNEAKRIAIEDSANGQAKLIITTALPRQLADVRNFWVASRRWARLCRLQLALVATWCLRIWHDAAANEDKSILGGLKKKLEIRNSQRSSWSVLGGVLGGP
ncbi:hypothetical protein F4808DRAFT_461409 [Astrocystis sublimbata]|nr:hypothetical protein F4808DRAFT_461409 [Astrocystis sublimbata]